MADAVEQRAQRWCSAASATRSWRQTFFQPTVLTGATPEMLCAQEETFAPVAPLFRFKTEEEAMRDGERHGVRPGRVFLHPRRRRAPGGSPRRWNTASSASTTGIISTEIAPFGGVKQSGLGREGSHYGIEEYLEIKYVCVDVAAPPKR